MNTVTVTLTEAQVDTLRRLLEDEEHHLCQQLAAGDPRRFLGHQWLADVRSALTAIEEAQPK